MKNVIRLFELSIYETENSEREFNNYSDKVSALEFTETYNNFIGMLDCIRLIDSVLWKETIKQYASWEETYKKAVKMLLDA